MAQSSNAVVIPRSTIRRGALVLAALVALAILVVVIDLAIHLLTPTDGLTAGVNSSRYQAVFLTNGQVYFGSLTSGGGGYYDLRHVYFLQSGSTSRTGSPSQQILVKLTKEIHGPEDEMIISGRQILFVENLSPSGCAAHLLNGQPCGP